MLAIALCIGIIGLLECETMAAEVLKADFFVSNLGKDTWSGRLAAPNKRRTDGPFATIARAQQAVRELRRKQPERQEPVVVMVRGGTYYLQDTLILTPEDSGSEESPTIYTAYPGERPVLSGGVRLADWKVTPQGYWQTTLPSVAAGKWSFCQLWVNGQRRYRPRLPKDTYYFIEAEAPPTPESQGKGYDRFVFKEGEIRADWHNPTDIDVLVFHIWTMSRLRIKAVDEATRTVTFGGPTVAPVWYADLTKGRRYIVENVREALERPGEWYLDSKTGVLTYIPVPGESPATSEVIAPRLERLVEIKGDPVLGVWVDNVIFRGLTFAHSNWVEPPQGFVFGQAEACLPGAISATGALNCALEGCAIRHVGTYAVEWGRGCKKCRLEDCDLIDLGAGGVKIGEMAIPGDPNVVAEQNIVRNCTIAQGGRLHPAGIGVWIGQSPRNRIEHNEIEDFYYSGISVGWTWGYGQSLARENIIEYNHVHQIGQNVLSDMGGIYTLGVSPGTVIRFNRFHDIDHYYYGGWGIYFDEGSSDILAENNVVYRTSGGCFHQHYGRNNILRNNIWAFDSSQQLARTRPENHLSFTFERNIVYWKHGVLLGGNWAWTGGNYKLDYNCYWNALGEPITFAGLPLEKWREERGQDLHSIIADPLFVDPDNADFRLKPNSPALQIGFQPFDISVAGRQTKSAFGPLRRNVPRAYPGPPPPQPLADSFEDTPVGAKPQLAEVYEDDETHVIRVTDETAATGRHSLKFTDGPALKHEFNPHMFYRPGFKSGTLEGAFALRLEPGAFAYHEWRHYPPNAQFIVGPSLWFQPDGWLVANGLRLLQVPYGGWMRFKIVCGVGENNMGKYNLTVWLPGEDQPRQFEGIKCDSRMRSLDWFGFTANGNTEAVFYLDDVSVRTLPEKKG